MHVFSEMNCTNTIFVSGHAHNVQRMKRIRHRKTWEGKGSKTTAEFLAYCSNRQHSKQWPKTKSIKPGHIHCVAQIIAFTQPGREGYLWDWQLQHIHNIDPPILLPGGVGQGGRFANTRNKHLITPFKQLMKQLKTIKTHAYQQ